MGKNTLKVDNNAGAGEMKMQGGVGGGVEKLIAEAGSSLALYNKIQSTESNNHPKQTRGIPISTLITQ